MTRAQDLSDRACGMLVAACQDSPTAPIAATGSVAAASVRAGDPTYIVVFHDSVRNVGALTNTLVSVHHGTLKYRYVSAIHGFAAAIPDSETVRLRRHPGVVHVERDAEMHIVGSQSNPPSWGLDRIDQVSLPLNSLYNYAVTGSGVNVYIIDTGILTTHVDFGGRASGVFTAIADGNGTNDCNGHGTHVSGTVAGAQYGVAKQAKLYAVRVLDCTGSGLTSGVIARVDWVTANAVKPAVANMSLGGSASTALDQAVTSSVAAGVTYAVAAGNSNADACLSSPSRAPAALTVGATDISDTRASFSNFGSCVDLFAPGVGITSDWATSNSATNTISGTSMASPHVAGVVALFLQTQPNATPAAVAAALTGNASAGRVANAGTGSPNLLLYMGFITVSDLPPVASFTWSCPGVTCTFDASGSTDDGSIVSYTWDFGKSPNGTGSGKVVTVTYPHLGTRNVTLTVTDNAGQTNSISKTITLGAPVDNPPVASFTTSCSGLTCSLNGGGSTDDGSSVSYAWSLPGSTTPVAVGVTTNVSYTTGGTKSITLTVTDNGGQTGSLTTTVTVAPIDNPPVASFSWSCAALSCTFDASASTDDGSIVAYDWDFNKSPNGSGSGKVVTALYPHGGLRNVKLTVTDNAGQTNSITIQITVM